MNPQTWWYLSRGSGVVAWVMLAATNLWGILLVTRMLRAVDRPAWLLDLHRWLGALAILTTGIHLGALVADNYAHFGWKEILVPNGCVGNCWPHASKTAAVTWGVIAMYIVVVVELSSLMMRKLPRKLTTFSPTTSPAIKVVTRSRRDSHATPNHTGVYGHHVHLSGSRPHSVHLVRPFA